MVRSVAVAVLAAVLVATAALSGCGGDAGGAAAPGDKITVAGDSISVGLGVALRDLAVAQADGATPREVKVIGEGGTGLARPDVFDWPERLERLAVEAPPAVLVISLASNDAQDLTDADGDRVVGRGDEDGWDEEYSTRLARAMDAFEGTGTTVVWVGHVRTEDERVAEVNRHVHDLAVELAAQRPWVEVEDLAELTGSGGDEVSECLLDDGLHLRGECYREAAEQLLERY